MNSKPKPGRPIVTKAVIPKRAPAAQLVTAVPVKRDLPAEKCGEHENDSDSDSDSDFDTRNITLNHGVVIPAADRFTPYSLTIRVGDSVTWRNNDGDEQHSVTSIDVINSAKQPAGVNHVLTGIGNPFTLTFNEPGQWLYYCRFHAALDEFNQPYRLEEDTARRGSKPTNRPVNVVNPPVSQQEEGVLAPMMGVITILPQRRTRQYDKQ